MSSLSHPKYHRQRIVKYAQKHSVTKTALRYRVSRKTVYPKIPTNYTQVYDEISANKQFIADILRK